MKPTIVLVHGAYAESSSWNDVITSLMREGHRVIAGPLRCGDWPRMRPDSPTWSGASRVRWSSSATPSAGR